MGNEMGNNSTSSLKEEDTIDTNVDDPKGLSNKTACVDDVKGENYLVHAAQDNDFHDKAHDFASHDPEIVDDVKPLPSRKEQEEKEVSVLADPPKVTEGLGETSNESTDDQHLYLYNDAEDESMIELNMNGITLESNEKKLQNKASARKEEEGMENSAFDPISILSHDPEPPKPEDSDCEQRELASIQADQTVPGESGSEEVLGLSLKSTMENGHLSEAEESDNTEAYVPGESEPSGGIEEVLKSSSGTENCHLSESEESENTEASLPGESEPSRESDEVLEYSSKSGAENGHLSDIEDSNNLQAAVVGDSEESRETEDVLTSSLKSSMENGGHLSESEEIESLEEVDAESDSVIEKKKDDLLVCDGEFEPKDGDQVDVGLIIVTAQETVLSGPSDRSDEGFSTEVSLVGDNSSESESEPETNSVANSPIFHQVAPETEDKCMIVTEKIEQREKEMENREYKCKPDYNSTDSETEAINHVNESKSNKDCPSEEAMVVENYQPVIDQKSFKESEGDIVIVTEHEIIPSDSNDDKEEESTEKRVVEERDDTTEPLHAIEIKTEEILLPVDQVEVVLAPQTLLSSAQFDQNDDQSIQELNQNSCGEFLSTEVSTFDSTNLIAEIRVSMNELAVDRTNRCIERQEVKAAEAKISRSEITRDSVERLSTGSMERFSTDSEPDHSNLHSQMRKSPSFNIDLQNEESESDRTPLLYHDKAPIQSLPSQDNASLGDPVRLIGQDQVVTMPLPMKEKVVKLERSDSEKSKTPFLGFLKEEEEAHVVVTSQQHSTNGSSNQTVTKDLWKSSSKEATSSTSPKGKVKRRVKSSLFGNCMCCATVIN